MVSVGQELGLAGVSDSRSVPGCNQGVGWGLLVSRLAWGGPASEVTPTAAGRSSCPSGRGHETPAPCHGTAPACTSAIPHKGTLTCGVQCNSQLCASTASQKIWLSSQLGELPLAGPSVQTFCRSGWGRRRGEGREKEESIGDNRDYADEEEGTSEDRKVLHECCHTSGLSKTAVAHAWHQERGHHEAQQGPRAP